MAKSSLLQAFCSAVMRVFLPLHMRNIIPDFALRSLLRLAIFARLRRDYMSSSEKQLAHILKFAQSLQDMPIAVHTDKLNSLQYEVPTSFFELVLEKHMKYSCSYFADDSNTLENAEKAMLDMYCERAQVEDGQTILDLGCGWGSLCLYIAEKYQNCKVTGITYSKTQKEYIDEQCKCRKLQNVEIVVADISIYEMDASSDRVFSIQMFEYMRNYKELLKKISKWMKEGSLLFVHHCCHKSLTYHFEDTKEEMYISAVKTYGDDWMARHFLTGITILSSNLLLYFQDDVVVMNQWLINGKNYTRTCEEWLKRIDKNMDAIKPILETVYGKDSVVKWTAYWRTYFIYLGEMFGYNNGEEWMISHILFRKR